MKNNNVELGKDSEVDEFVILGYPTGQNKKTSIGKNARIRSHTVIYEGNVIGDKFHAGHAVNIRENNVIGNNVSVGTKTIIEHDVVIKDDVRIHSAAFVPEFTIIKENAWIGPGVILTNARYPKGKNVKETLKGPIIGKNAKIGANVTVLPGVEIGENSLIGAGSVVTKNIEANKVAVGNPAKVIKDITELDVYDD
jgi:acetyltransferase-like isoleucine patch superfamily enzyme